jgi:F420-dependent oxidoreductase-like protein
MMPAVNACASATPCTDRAWCHASIPTIGFIGAPVLFLSSTATLFGVFGQVSSRAAIAALPIATWELSLRIRLVVKGFKPSPITANGASTPAMDLERTLVPAAASPRTGPASLSPMAPSGAAAARQGIVVAPSPRGSAGTSQRGRCPSPPEPLSRFAVMRFAIWPSLTQSWDDVVAVARHAESTGWDGLYVADHFMGPGGTEPEETPTLEATAALAALAADTNRLRLASLVLSVTYRHPAVLAKWAATVDEVSGGRFLLGVGAGWQENEHRQYGLALGTPPERLHRFDEALSVIRGLLSEARTTVVGDHYQVRDAVAFPKPVNGRLPILVGGKGDRMLGLVARHADEWNMWSLPEQFAERSAVLDAHCERQGRDPATIARSTQALLFVLDEADASRAGELTGRVAPRPALAGTAAQLAEQIAAYAEAGVDELIVPDFTLGRGARRAEQLDQLLAAFAPLR